MICLGIIGTSRKLLSDSTFLVGLTITSPHAINGKLHTSEATLSVILFSIAVNDVLAKLIADVQTCLLRF